MISIRMKHVAMMFFVLSLFSGSVGAAQRRVFTNEDVQSSPPPSAQPSEAAEPTAAAPASEAAPQAASLKAGQSGPPDEVKRLTAIQTALGVAFDDLAARIQQGADQSTLDRWTVLRDSLGSLLAEYRSFVGVPNIGRFAMLRMKYDLF